MRFLFCLFVFQETVTVYAVMFFFVCLFPQLKKYIYIYLGEQNFMVKCQQEVETSF